MNFCMVRVLVSYNDPLERAEAYSLGPKTQELHNVP